MAGGYFIMSCLLALGLLTILLPSIICLDNGLALTPPMGWLHWERFRCNTDCQVDPDNCISEKLFKTMADVMVTDGYKNAGYEYVIIDDCWLAMTRDVHDRLQPDPVRFPSGIRALADYIHGKGLKFGIYGDFGTATCAHYPGNEYYLQLDAQTYAEWTVDYFKFDGCNADPHQFDDAFPAMSRWLNRTGRPMLYNCAWPWDQVLIGMTPNYQRVAQYCNTWRNYADIEDSWDHVSSIIEFYGTNNGHFIEVAGPGAFNDPDMLIIGNFGLSFEQQRVQMALWSVMAAPLIMSADIRNIKPESRSLLLNRSAIAINQDKLGKPGNRVYKSGDIQGWTKAISPAGCWAFALMNTGSSIPVLFSIKLADLGLRNAAGYNVTEVFDERFIGVFKPTDLFKMTLNPTGVFFGRAVLLQ